MPDAGGNMANAFNRELKRPRIKACPPAAFRQDFCLRN